MKRLLVGAWMVTGLIVAGCGSNPAAPSNPTAVQFRLDTNSCGSLFGTQTLGFSFFVDGVSVGGDALGIGKTSQAFPVAAGSHVASASVTNTTVRWQNLNFTVAQGQTFTYVLTC